MRRERIEPAPAQCWGKAGYQTYDHAAVAIRRQFRRVGERSGLLKPYWCAHCCHWHIGGGKDRRKR